MSSIEFLEIECWFRRRRARELTSSVAATHLPLP
jgi:hypothetical protein